MMTLLAILAPSLWALSGALAWYMSMKISERHCQVLIKRSWGDYLYLGLNILLGPIILMSMLIIYNIEGDC